MKRKQLSEEQIESLCSEMFDSLKMNHENPSSLLMGMWMHDMLLITLRGCLLVGSEQVVVGLRSLIVAIDKFILMTMDEKETTKQ